MTEEKAKQLFEKWVKILHLESWEIEFKWKVRGTHMNLPDSCGCSTFNYSTGQAVIQMIDPDDYPADTSFEYDYEKTLVHELLHLKFAAIDDDENRLMNKMLHRLIDDMARALVASK